MQIALALWSECYTLKEKFNYPRGNSFSLKYLWDVVLATDLIEQVPALKVPVYIFQGKYDYQVSYTIAKEFTKAIIAPVKGFYSFENSAHSPCFEEPEKCIDILLKDVLQEKVDLSDDRETTRKPGPESQDKKQ